MVYYTLNKELLPRGKDSTSPYSSIPYTYKIFQTVKEPSSAHVSLHIIYTSYFLAFSHSESAHLHSTDNISHVENSQLYRTFRWP